MSKYRYKFLILEIFNVFNIRHILSRISTIMIFHFVNPQFFLIFPMLERFRKKVPIPSYRGIRKPKTLTPHQDPRIHRQYSYKDPGIAGMPGFHLSDSNQ